ncbi:type II toxin-antitoxin system VapC family toxin [candidate division KSB1 bacterium]|nr:type II toxin-antitoxin system VapC family toxin [candidate division KSB1 bacterium]
MTRTFVDTAFVVALVNSNDQYHAKAQNLSEMYETEPLIITDVVLLEIGNALARDYKKEAIEIIESFRTSKEVLIVELSLEFFDKAFELYKKYTDKDWGMVDCISFIVMREYEVRNALTFDDHFRQAGFNVLMKN